MHHKPECVIEPWAGLFVAAYVTELAGGFYGYAKLYTNEPRDAWCPDALMKVGSAQCPCPVEALDSALERAFLAIHDIHAGRTPALWRELLLRAAAGACVKSTKHARSTYLRFLELAGSRSRLLELGPDEERLFLNVALAQYEGESLSVRSVMALRQLGSPATIHTRLKALRATGWVKLADTVDSRRKQVVLTEVGMREVRRLSRYMIRACG
jgi:hypothetical protein